LHDSGLSGFLKCIICNSTNTFLLKNKLRNYIDEKMGYGYKCNIIMLIHYNFNNLIVHYALSWADFFFRFLSSSEGLISSDEEDEEDFLDFFFFLLDFLFFLAFFFLSFLLD
jgi:hypothetical protein